MSVPESKPATLPKPVAKAETTPAAKAEVKPVAKAEITPSVKPADTTETKSVAKIESKQAGKGSKRRPFNAKKFGANYGAILWGKGQAQRPKR